MNTRRNWLVVASAEHVAIGRRGGFMQACHGKRAPLARMQPGDRVACYSPNRRFSADHASRARDRLQAFTAVGTISEGAPYQVDTADNLNPYRRDVAWHDAGEVPIADLHGRLALLQESNWGYRLRRGVVELSDADMTAIAEAMFLAAAPWRQAA